MVSDRGLLFLHATINVELVASSCGLRNGSQKTRYFTAPRELDLADRVLGEGRWFDVAGDEESPAWRRCAGGFSIRRGEDALRERWPNMPIGINPPFDLASAFLAKGSAHAASTRKPVLFIVSAAVGSEYWRDRVWPHAIVCMMCPRPSFVALEPDGSTREAEHPTSVAAVMFGGDRDLFTEVWRERGVIVRAVDLATNRTQGELTLSYGTC